MTLVSDPTSETIDLASTSLRELNQRLHGLTGAAGEPHRIVVANPRGLHNIAVGLDAPVEVLVEGHAGYYCAGMNKQADVRVTGNVGPGVAENMMSGSVIVEHNASQYAGATARGGLLVIRGNAAGRCGISLKGADLVVDGSIGAMGAFLAQTGRMVVCGDTGDGLGDSIYETRLYVRGKVAGLGADCIEKEMREEHLAELRELLERAGVSDADASEFHRYGSGRKLYNFDIDHAGEY